MRTSPSAVRRALRPLPESPLMTVWIYVDTSKDVGDAEHLKVFADEDAADAWFRENDPEGVAFEDPVED
jgi:hypothetical protein